MDLNLAIDVGVAPWELGAHPARTTAASTAARTPFHDTFDLVCEPLHHRLQLPGVCALHLVDFFAITEQ